MQEDEKSIDEIVVPLKTGMALEKCHKCGCMINALKAAEAYFADHATEEQKNKLKEYWSLIEPMAYDCLGCKVCWGAEAENLIDPNADAVCAPATIIRRSDWPMVAGDFVLGNSSASIAVCTLGDLSIAAKIVEAGDPFVAIAGKCETENIGIEKIILNIISNPRIRSLVLCGPEVEGHLPGDTLLKLAKNGIDSNLKVVEAIAHRPRLKNVSLVEISRFREQVQVIDKIACSDLDKIVSLVGDLAGRKVPPLSIWFNDFRSVSHITARQPKSLKLDQLGFFVIISDPSTALITCEHYSNDGSLTKIIEGQSAALIASTAIEEGLVGQVDHAAYLGRELARAELALKLGQEYVQDKALGEIDMNR